MALWLKNTPISPDLAGKMQKLDGFLTDAIDELKQEAPEMSITGLQPGAIAEKLQAIKKAATERRASAMGKLDAAHAKAAMVDDELERVAQAIEKEADDALHEFAQFTNGAPVENG